MTNTRRTDSGITEGGRIQRDRLLWIMRQAGVTVEALAGDLGITPRTFLRKASRRSSFTAEELDRLCGRIDLRPAFLMGVFFHDA